MTVFSTIAAGLFISFAFIVVHPQFTSAQSSQLQQQIKPIECIYTTTVTGGSSTLNSTCDNQPVPTVSEVIINGGAPIIVGTYESTTARSLRVWLDAQWYTNGVDPRLKTESDIWTLNLSGTSMLLRAGSYTVIVEVETIGGLLLRNTFAATFRVLPGTSTIMNPIVQEAPRMNGMGVRSISTYFATPSPLQSYQIASLQKPVTNPFTGIGGFFSPFETRDWLLRRIITGIVGLGLVFLALRYALILYRR